MPFDFSTGKRNELFAEQLLASELGEKVEQAEGARRVTLVRLEELFRPVLHKECIDLNWPAEQQLNTFLKIDAPFIAFTQDDRYSILVSRATLVNQVLKSLVIKNGISKT
jgi:hypothetical protein